MLGGTAKIQSTQLPDGMIKQFNDWRTITFGEQSGEMTGRVDRLDMRRALDHWKAGGVDLSKILYQMPAKAGVSIWNSERQDHGLDKALDHTLIAAAQPALERREPVQVALAVGTGLLTVDTIEQARARSGQDGHNKGAEAASAAACTSERVCCEHQPPSTASSSPRARTRSSLRA